MLLAETDDVAGHGEEDRPADGGHLVDDITGEHGFGKRGKQRQQSLKQKQGDGGENDARTEGGGKGHGADKIHDAFGIENAVIMVKPCADGAENGHAPDAEEHEAGDDRVPERPLSEGRSRELAFGPVPGAGDALVEAEKHPDECADHKGEHHDEKALCPGGTLNADAGGDKAHDLHDAGGVLGADLAAEQRPECAADEHGDGVDDSTEHNAGPLGEKINLGDFTIAAAVFQ